MNYDLDMPPYIQEMADWLDDSKKVHQCNFDHACLGAEIMLAMQRSAAEGGQVALPLASRRRRASPAQGQARRPPGPRLLRAEQEGIRAGVGSATKRRIPFRRDDARAWLTPNGIRRSFLLGRPLCALYSRIHERNACSPVRHPRGDALRLVPLFRLGRDCPTPERAGDPHRRPAVGRDELRRASAAQDAEPRPAGRRRRAVRQHVRHHLALLAQPRVAAERPLRAPPRRAEQLHRVSRLAAQLPQAPARGRLRNGLLRQVAHGRDQRRAAHRLRLLDEPPRPGQLLRQRVEHQRPDASSSRATTRRSSPSTPSSGCSASTTSPSCSSSARRRRTAGRSSRSRSTSTPSTARPSPSPPTTTPGRDGKPAWLAESFPTWHGAGGPLYNYRDYDKFVRAYLGTLLSVDDSVGRLYETLKQTGPARPHGDHLHLRQRLRAGRARARGQAHDVRGKPARPAAGALPAADPQGRRSSTKWSSTSTSPRASSTSAARSR